MLVHQRVCSVRRLALTVASECGEKKNNGGRDAGGRLFVHSSRLADVSTEEGEGDSPGIMAANVR